MAKPRLRLRGENTQDHLVLTRNGRRVSLSYQDYKSWVLSNKKLLRGQYQERTKID
jgi:hypothetical protein